MKQSQALAIMKTGVNVFLTGQPGSGKTYVINEYVSYLKSFGIEPAITAATGIAATHIGGLTIHSWSGIGIKEKLSKSDLTNIAANRRVARRIANAKVLIVDEVSMLKPQTLEMIDAVCRKVKKNSSPFGGLQIILVGDFFQLPPVLKKDEEEAATDLFGTAKQRFAFQSFVWQKADLKVCYLTEQYRQDDGDFLNVLQAIRQNKFSDSHLALIKLQVIEYLAAPAGAPKLFSHNADVDHINDKKLNELPGKAMDFIMSGRGPKPLVAALQKGCLSPEVLSLKKGAAVMFTKNDSGNRYVNGTLGTVLGFDEKSNYPIVQTKDSRQIEVLPADWTAEENGIPRAKISQLPLRLAWSITIHKSQGMSLDQAVIDLSKVFEAGQGYVALSRVRRLSGLFLLGYNRRAFEVDKQVLEKDKDFLDLSFKTQAELAEVLPAEIEKQQRDFIIACGGDLNARPSHRRVKIKTDTKMETLTLWRAGKDIAAIAKQRGLTQGTILNHLEKLAAKNLVEKADLNRILSMPLQKSLAEIAAAFNELGFERLSPVFEKLGGRFSYDELRLCRLVLAPAEPDESASTLNGRVEPEELTF
ncbi:MAG: helix-turn-helix domain-containing protein [Patescibacteria group bacterium]|jgi:DNA-binding CsgD family transcriptional regulator